MLGTTRSDLGSFVKGISTSMVDSGGTTRTKPTNAPRIPQATRDPFLVPTVMGHVPTDTTRGYVLISPHAAALPVEQISRLATVVS